MDIIKKVKPLQITYEKISRQHKTGIFLIIVSLFNFIFPHSVEAVVYNKKPEPKPQLIFEIGNHVTYMNDLTKLARQMFQKQKLLKELEKQSKLSMQVAAYLRSQRSPMADYADVLVRQNNWKKIVALANAESTMCRRYPETTSNCWGVGGSDLWDMGENLGEGIVAMNQFLNNHPKRSKVKYSQMDFARMNGLYKQPAADHWVYNNQVIYEDLTKIEQSL